MGTRTSALVGLCGALILFVSAAACRDGGAGAAVTSAGSSSSSGAVSSGGASGSVLEAGTVNDTGPGVEPDGAALDAAHDAADDAPVDPATFVQRIGRFDLGDPAGPRFAWSASTLRVRFSGTGIDIKLAALGGSQNQFDVRVDGALQARLRMQDGVTDYTLAANLVDGPHDLEVFRRTEALLGLVQFQGFSVHGGGVLLPGATRKARHIEFVGDSITCGFGNEGLTQKCGFSAETENAYLAFGAVAARALDAEHNVVAWQGRGMVRNLGNHPGSVMPYLFERVLPEDPASQWSFAAAPPPDVVVINLGSNDFYVGSNDNPSALFTAGYVAFLERLRAVYPNAYLFATASGNAGHLQPAATATSAAVQARNATGDAKVYFLAYDSIGYSACEYHPSVAEHQAMASKLVAAIRSVTGW